MPWDRGGNLINLTTNRILSLCLLLFTGCANAATDNPHLECAISAIGEETIAKIHYKQRRFFVVRNKVEVETLTPLIKGIENCLAKHEWSMKWSLSVFADKGLATRTNLRLFHFIPIISGRKATWLSMIAKHEHLLFFQLFPQELSV